MADIDKITVNNTTYNVKDATARDSISCIHAAGGNYNLNELKDTGIYFCLGSSTNMPSGSSYGMLIVGRAHESVSVQLFTDGASLYIRRVNAGTWFNWAQV